MPITKKDRAIILKTIDHGESDKIVTLITVQHGKINAIAKGARRSKKRFLNALEPFTCLSVVMAQTRPSSMHRIDSASINNSFSEIRNSYNDYLMASLCCELTSLWTREADRCSEIFHLLHWYLVNLTRFTQHVNITLFFKIQLLNLSGTGIQCDRCIKCGSGIPERPEWSFAPDQGGFFCNHCHSTPAPLGRDIPLLLKHIAGSPKEKLNRLRINEWQSKVTWHILRDMHCHQLGREPASYKLITL
jgi:DNA repair protein RecO (recombination protein O)